MPGSITYGILTATSNSFDTVTNLSRRDILDIPEWKRENYIESHQDIKTKINKIYFMNLKAQSIFRIIIIYICIVSMKNSKVAGRLFQVIKKSLI